jgi:hypothetical protein
MGIFDIPKDCIRTNSGLFINVFEPTSEMIFIGDIAHALASMPRFGGHLNKHYSVGQHSVRCCDLAESIEDKKAALMHDASEAYMLDIPTPIKAMLPDYKKYESNLMSFIANKYGFEFPLSENVHRIDHELLVTEFKDLVEGNGDDFEVWSHERSKTEFLKRYNMLFEERICL